MSDTPETPLFDPARLPVPDDKTGYFYHPDIPDDDDNESYDVAKALNVLGFEWKTAEFEFDAPEELIEDYYERDDLTATARWAPTVPDGEGWMLVGKGDADDGPWALFVRRKP
jgi:hypothetical protein